MGGFTTVSLLDFNLNIYVDTMKYLIIALFIVCTQIDAQTSAAKLVVMHNFNGTDGDGPTASPLYYDNWFYATTGGGGSYGLGTLFRIAANGTFEKLVDFDGNNGGHPFGAMISYVDTHDGSQSALIGITQFGGKYGNGTIFMLKQDLSLITCYHFDAIHDGADPIQIALSPNTNQNTVLAVTGAGGSQHNGTVIEFMPNFKGCTIVDNLYYSTLNFPSSFGSYDNFALVTDLYGCDGKGAIYIYDPYGTPICATEGNNPIMVTITHDSSFTAYGTSVKSIWKVESYGFYKPVAYLVIYNSSTLTPFAVTEVDSTTLYGAASPLFDEGMCGELFKFDTTMNSYSVLYAFTGIDGCFPKSTPVTVDGKTYYGVTYQGGQHGNGTFYALREQGI